MNPLTTAFENQLVEPSVARNIFESGFILRDTAKGNVHGRARDMLAILYTANRFIDFRTSIARVYSDRASELAQIFEVLGNVC